MRPSTFTVALACYACPPRRRTDLHIAIEKEDVGAMLAHEDENRVEHVVYYLSKKFLPYEANYNLVEKTCLSVVWAIKKL